jgi:hypothetical protein
LTYSHTHSLVEHQIRDGFKHTGYQTPTLATSERPAPSYYYNATSQDRVTTPCSSKYDHPIVTKLFEENST